MATTSWTSTLRTPLGATATALMSALALLAVLGPVLWGDEAKEVDTDSLGQSPSGEHWLGTDALGRDILLRVLVAARFSIGLALAATLITVVIGLILGIMPSLLGRRGRRLSVELINLLVAFPGLLLALFFAVIFGIGARGAVLAIGIAGAPSFARLVHTLTSSAMGRDYIAAARVAGVGNLRIVRRHVLPNIGEPLVVNATTSAGFVLLAFSGLSFLGLGVQPPSYDWGRLLGEGLDKIYVSPAAALAPGVAVVLACLAFTLFGEALARQIGLRSDVVLGTPSPAPHVRGEQVLAAQDPVLTVRDLSVEIPTSTGLARPVDGVSFDIARGESVGIVGESGSGKSLMSLAVARLIPEPGKTTALSLVFEGVDLQTQSDKELRTLLGTSLAMVFQDPMSSLNPAMRVGRQLGEVALLHADASRREAALRAIDRLRMTLVPAAERRARQYPHELSGGLRQRAMIAMGLMGSPALIIADEPTTALDRTVQRGILSLLTNVQTKTNAGLLFISHDINAVAQVCGRVLVMYAGRVVEDIPTEKLHAAQHPYTRALLAAAPSMETDIEEPLTTIPGQPPDPRTQRTGCAFADRCSHATANCLTEDPRLTTDAADHGVACWNPQTAEWERTVMEASKA